MSNIIPMVSSSPPPIDDGGGFGWDDDDDDFGTFASANDSFQTPAKTVNHDEPFMNSVPDTSMQDDDFANFEAFTDQKSQDIVTSVTKDVNVDNRPDTIPIVEEDQANEIDDVSVKTDDGNFGSSDKTLVDSGVYSSNISPVQQCDDTSVYKHCNDKIDSTDNLTAVSTSESVVNSVQQSGTVIDTNHSCAEPESCPAHLTIPNDNIEPQVVCLDDNESNEADKCENTGTSIPEQGSSLPQSHIPNEDIPSNAESDAMNSDHNSTNSVAEFITSDLNTRTNKESENESESHETKSGSEAENNDCEETNACQNQLQSDLSFDSDLKTKDTEQLTQSANTESDLVGPVDDSAEGICGEITSSAIKERLNGDCNTELNIDTENGDGVKSDVVNSECSISEPPGNDESVGNEITTKDVLKTVDEDGPTNTDKVTVEGDSHEVNDLTEKSEFSEAFKPQSDNVEEIADVNKSGDINDTSHTSENELADSDGWDEFSEFSSQVDTKTASNVGSDENKGFGDFNNASTFTDTRDNDTSSSNSGNKENDDDHKEDEFSDFSQNIKNDSDPVDDKGDSEEADEFGDFNASFEQKVSTVNDDEFGDFNASFEQNASAPNNDEFGDFNATFETETEKTEEQSNDWAAFSEPQIVKNTDSLSDDDDDGDEWSGFADDSEDTVSQQDSRTAHVVKEDTDSKPPSQLAHMSNHEKVMYAVTACFPAIIVDMDITSSHDPTSLSAFSLVSEDSGVWSHVESQRKTNALTYQWTKSQWNTQLFTTLHIDTQNILIGHKKAVVPVFASGLTLLEPTKGSTSLKPDVLVDTSKVETVVHSQSQISTVMRPNKNDSIPAAEFDWSGSGLTNPLEANNKTLNLDFLIQDQAAKSNALESEFIGTNDSPVHKPTIQPLENILANLKPSSTFKPTNQSEDYSKEASKIVQSLPDLSFMTSKVLMFPVKIDGS